MLVIDASVTIARSSLQERTAAIVAIFDDLVTRGAIVPPPWKSGVANVLQMQVRRNRLSAIERDGTFHDLSQLGSKIDPHAAQHLWTDTVKLAHRYDLTVYDATYLEVSLCRNLPLASLDGGLRKTAQLEGLQVLGL